MLHLIDFWMQNNKLDKVISNNFFIVETEKFYKSFYCAK